MSIPYENVDESILNRMGDLSDMIGQTGYVAGSPEQLPEGTNLSGVGDPNAPSDLGNYVGNVAQPGQVIHPAGVVPAQQMNPQPVQPAVDVAAMQAERQRLEQVAYNASMARIQAEEARFQAEIANYSDEEKERATLARELEQTREVNGWLNTQVNQAKGQLTAAQQRQQQVQQESAKKQWAILYAHRYGLPIENQAVRAALHAAEDPQQMDGISQQLVGIMNQRTQVASQNQINSGILAAGSGGTTPPTRQGPKRGSGDISGLIASRSPQTVSWG
jgi:hypothetical protein